MKILPMLPEAQEQLDQLLGSDVPLGILTDVIGYMLDIDVRRQGSPAGRVQRAPPHGAAAEPPCGGGRRSGIGQVRTGQLSARVQRTTEGILSTRGLRLDVPPPALL